MSEKPASPISITSHALVLVKGPDAGKFLQGQVTCDIQQLATHDSVGLSCLGAHCTPKGRMLFSFRAVEMEETTIALRLPVTLMESALAALKKYSIFSKVELMDARSDYQILGLQANELGFIEGLFPTQPKTADAICLSDSGALICIGDGRFEAWLTTDVISTLNLPSHHNKTSDDWTLADIQQGIGEVRPETTEMFIPQMLNYQVVANGISFEKGCYTGQEVVARMQYLGKLKRRMYRFHCDFTPQLKPGDPLYGPDNQQSIGNVVIASHEATRQELLAVVTKEVVAADQVYIDSECKQKLQLLPLPYTLTE